MQRILQGHSGKDVLHGHKLMKFECISSLAYCVNIFVFDAQFQSDSANGHCFVLIYLCSRVVVLIYLCSANDI